MNRPPQQREEPEIAEAQWYGWQTLASDVASIGVFLTGLEVSNSQGVLEDGSNAASDSLLVLGVAGYVAGAPAIHVLHHRPVKGLVSVGMRASLPLIGAAIGASSAPCPPPTGDYGNCGLAETLGGFGLGLLTAIIVDAGVLAWDAPTNETPRPGPTIGFAPSVSSDGKRSELRVYGTF